MNDIAMQSLSWLPTDSAEWAAWATAVAALVQAATAVVIWRLTRRLVAASHLYADEARAMALEIRRTNDTTGRSIERALRTNAPFIVLRESTRGHPNPGEWTFHYIAQNTGATTAHAVTLHTEHGLATGDEPVKPDGQSYNISLFVEHHWEERPKHPRVEHMTFTDPGGTTWRQVPGSLPELADGPVVPSCMTPPP
jgi:hypothetical protein